MDIDKIVDTAFEQNMNDLKRKLSMELYPDAFANEYSWLRVQAAIDATVSYTKAAVKDALVEFERELK